MRLRFGPDDERAFAHARDRLIESYEERHPDQGWLAALMLDMKWSHLDGDLGTWHEHDVEAILLDLVPAKVSLDDDDLGDVVPALRALLSHLADGGHLSGGARTAARLDAHAAALEDEFLARARDSANWSFGKRMWAAAMEEGVDPEDPAAIQRWMDDFNARPFDERDAILGPLPGGPPPPAWNVPLPPVTIAPVPELEAAAAASTWVRRMAAFVDYVGDGLALTAKGNLKLADGKALIEVLGTPDQFDETFGEHTYSTRSTRELEDVDLAFRLAAAAGFVRIDGRRVLPGPGAEQPAADPLPALYDVWLALVTAVGPTRHRHYRDTYGFGWYAEDLDRALAPLHVSWYAHGAPVAIADVFEGMWEQLQQNFDLGHVPDDKLAFHGSLVEHAIRRALHRFEELGVVAMRDVELVPGDFGQIDEVGGTVELTDLGRWVVQRFASRFTEAPVVGTLRDATAAELLRAAADLPGTAADGEIDAWIAQHGPEAARLLVDALPGAGETARQLGLQALARLGDAAREAVAALDDHPELAPYTVLWRPGGPAAADSGGDPERFVGTLAAVVEVLGTGALADWVGPVAGAAGAAKMLEAAWRVDAPATATVLDAIGREHPDKAVAKAARKALFKYRSARTQPPQ